VEAQSSSLKNSILALAASFILVLCTAVFALFYALTQAYLEVIPLDWGWLGLVFILVNGYFFSLAFNRSCVSFTERLLLSIGLGFGFTCFSLILLGVSWGFSFSSVLLAQLVLLCVSIGTALLALAPTNFQSRNITPLTPLQETLAALICVRALLRFSKQWCFQQPNGTPSRTA
jgi:hypothetical protein